MNAHKENKKMNIADKIKTVVDKIIAGDASHQTLSELESALMKGAVGHLLLIDDMIKQLRSCSNTNLWDVANRLELERTKLVNANQAYADAQEIIDVIRRHERLVRERSEAIDNPADPSLIEQFLQKYMNA